MFRVWFLFCASLCFFKVDSIESSYQCGIRKHSFVPLVNRGYKVEEGTWPWHAGLFHKTSGDTLEYACGGTLIDQKHILTAAHCVWNHDTNYALPTANIVLHFGQRKLSKITNHTQIRDVSKIHIHPEYSTHKNDVAVLEMRLPVTYTNFVIPICLDQRVDIDLRKLEGQRGWITGWGRTESGNPSDVLRTASMPMVNYTDCLKDDRTTHGNLLDEKVFCAGDRNGTSPGTGDSGGGMYFSDGDRWVLRGIVSYAKMDEKNLRVDTSKFTVFVNVQRFITWIKEIIDKSDPNVSNREKRKSEQECDRYQNLVAKRSNGVCTNSRRPHMAAIIYEDDKIYCSGFLVNENHILTAASCRKSEYKISIKVRFDTTEYDILKFTPHPKYRTSNRYHDLAVVKLKTKVQLSKTVVPACLASNWTENLYDTLLLAGFGVERISKDAIPIFIESDENQVITTEECNRLYPKVNNLREGITPDILCVKNEDRLTSELGVFAGSALQSVNSRTCMHTVVGVLFGSILWNGTDIHTRVAYHLDWIEQIVWRKAVPLTNLLLREMIER